MTWRIPSGTSKHPMARSVSVVVETKFQVFPFFCLHFSRTFLTFFSILPILRIASLLQMYSNHSRNDHHLYIPCHPLLYCCIPFSLSLSLSLLHSPYCLPLHLYTLTCLISFTSIFPFPSLPPSLSAATQRICEHRCTARLLTKGTHRCYREEDAVCCSPTL